MGTWGFFIGFAAVALCWPAAHNFQTSMGVVELVARSARCRTAAHRLAAPYPLQRPRWREGQALDGVDPLSRTQSSACGAWSPSSSRSPTVTFRLYPVVLLFGFMSGCGVAFFSVGDPQVSLSTPVAGTRTRNLWRGCAGTSPGIFTLFLLHRRLRPRRLLLLRLAAIWHRHLCACFTRDAWFFQLPRRQGLCRRRGGPDYRLDPGTGALPHPSVWARSSLRRREQRAWASSFSISSPSAASWRSPPRSRRLWINLRIMSGCATLGRLRF